MSTNPEHKINHTPNFPCSCFSELSQAEPKLNGISAIVLNVNNDRVCLEIVNQIKFTAIYNSLLTNNKLKRGDIIRFSFVNANGEITILIHEIEKGLSMQQELGLGI